MASMQNEDFDPDQLTPHVSLRCMAHDQNTVGGQYITNFRKYWGDDYKPGGITLWAGHHIKQAALAYGDEFYVQFNFDSFGTYGQDPIEDRVRE